MTEKFEGGTPPQTKQKEKQEKMKFLASVEFGFDDYREEPENDLGEVVIKEYMVEAANENEARIAIYKLAEKDAPKDDPGVYAPGVSRITLIKEIKKVK